MSAKRFKENWYHLLVLLFTTTIFGITVWFSQTTFPTNSSKNGSNNPLASWLGFSSGLAILNTLQKITSTCTTFAVAQSLEILEWSLSNIAIDGLLLSTFLLLSPATSILGILAYAVSRKSRIVDRLCALGRVLLLLVIWLSGIGLFINTSFGTAYDLGVTFNVTAGIGSFNGSFVAPTLRFVNNRLSYWTLATATTFLQNPQFSTAIDSILCNSNNSSCESYFLAGGIQSINPTPPASNLDPVVVIQGSLGSQVEFSNSIDVSDRFKENDCIAYGNEEFVVGLKLCVARSSVFNGSIIAAVFICSQGVSQSDCRGPGPRLNVSTTMTTFKRRAVVTGARSNNSILSISQLTAPSINPISDMQDFQLALGWLLNYTAADLTPVSSIVFQFWNLSPGLSEHDWAVEAYKTLTSILAFTSWYFNSNNYGNPQYSTVNTFQILPKELQTTAVTARPITRLIIDRKMLILYGVLQGIPLACCWAVLLWKFFACLSIAEVSAFPVLDIIFKAQWRGTPEIEEAHMRTAGSKEFIAKLKNARLLAL